MMEVVFEDLRRETMMRFVCVIQLNAGYHKIGGRVVKGFWLVFADPNTQDRFMPQAHYRLDRVSI